MNIRVIGYIAIGCWLALTIGNMISEKYATATVTGMLLIFSTLMLILNTLQEVV